MNTIWGSFDPLGYSLLVLRPVLIFGGNLAYVALVQHGLGMAMAGALYALMVRRGAWRWLAALAVAPVLLDAYQLNAEQTIMPDVLFETLLVAGIVLLLWQPGPACSWSSWAGWRSARPPRSARWARRSSRRRWSTWCSPRAAGARKVLHGVVLTFCFALPVLGYMSYSAVIMHYGFELSNMGNAYLYGRAAHAADCATLKIPARRAAAVPEPAGRRHAGRGRPGQLAGVAAGAVPAGQRPSGHTDRHPAAAEGDGLQRAQAAAAAGGGRHRQGLGETLCA